MKRTVLFHLKPEAMEALVVSVFGRTVNAREEREIFSEWPMGMNVMIVYRDGFAEHVSQVTEFHHLFAVDEDGDGPRSAVESSIRGQGIVLFLDEVAAIHVFAGNAN